ncbi:MAG: lysophospholipid acyltransferase family protein [Deferribacterota bacterium]|nr:lysophospholipid acyltransferase family protein [Deferribacterota bacterium]
MTAKDKYKKINRKIRNTSIFARLLVKICNINIISDIKKLKNDNANLFVSNHLSYLDILCIAAVIPVSFISTKEVEHSPLLGLFAKAAGSIFIERRNKKKLLSDIEQIKNILNANLNLHLFPEGTTTKGQMLPFKSSFFKLAENSTINIKNICIKYTKINDKPVNSANGDLVFYYGDMTFWRHFFNFLKIKKLNIELLYAGELKNLRGRKEIAIKSYNQIKTIYNQ